MQTRSLLAGAFATGSCCLANSAFAETVFSVFLGATRTRDSDLRIEQPATASPAEGKWNGTPVNETAPLGSRVENFSISHGVNLLALDAIYRFNVDPTPAFPHGRLHPYVGAGWITL